MNERRPPSTLALVRHGESAWITEGRFQGRGDPPLSSLGERQATAVAERLAAPAAAPAVPVPPGPPQAIWHSPLMRAARTAHAIHGAQREDVPLLALDSLAELGQGEWEGLTHAEVAARYPAELAAWRDDPLHHQAPGGETLQEARSRVQAAARTMLEGGPYADLRPQSRDASTLDADVGARSVDRDVPPSPWSIVVAHDGSLRLLLLDLLGIGIERFWSFPFALASVSVLDLTSGVARLRAHNLDEHVAALDR